MLSLICAFLRFKFTHVAGSELVVPFVSFMYKGEYALRTSEVQALQTRGTEVKPLEKTCVLILGCMQAGI
jgi:hypothetical protein